MRLALKHIYPDTMTRTASRRTLGLAVAGALALSLAGCLGYDGEISRGYIYDQQSISQVKTNTSAEQVLAIMGTPSTTSTVGGDAWYYISQKTDRKLQFMEPKIVEQRVVAIYFTKGKKVERTANYGLEDGQVIDFVSRTTPTGGAEAAFLKNMFKSLLRFT